MPDKISDARETNEHRSSARCRPAILQIVPRLDSGGAERSTVDIAAALAREGFAAIVASAGGRMVAELEAKGGEWIAMPVDTKSPLTLFANAHRLRTLIRTRKIGLVHARSRAPAWSALVAARGTRIPFVTTYHGAYSTESAIKRFYNSVMLRGDAVIANSEWTALQIRTKYATTPAKLVTIRRGVDLDAFDPARIPRERVETLRRNWRVRSEEIVVFFPGRLSRRKGQLVAIEAFAALAAEHPELRLVLAGEGRDDYAAEVERSIQRNGLDKSVMIAGHVDDMPAAYLASDIVVFTSREPEGFGRVAAEAGAMGRPVVVADQGGAREAILPGISGILLPSGDATALAWAIKEIVALPPEARAAMGDRGRTHVLENFTLERMAVETLSLYRELLAATT
jgi:glycosyltransferase involved in cell wall biosynthesis